MNIWLYHINPKSVYGYEYGWDVRRPQSILRSPDRTWSSRGARDEIAIKDLICVYMKNIGDKPDGVHIVGRVKSVDVEGAEFTWQPDRKRCDRTLVYPIPPETIHRFFPRSYGWAIQQLDPRKRNAWLKLIGTAEDTDAVPRVNLRLPPAKATTPGVDPVVVLEHGRIGEKHVLKILRERYSAEDGYKVIHVSADVPGADHDIAVTQRGRTVHYVEVKARTGKAGDAVPISERQIALRRSHRGRHSIFVVYLGPKASVREVVEIADNDAYTLTPLQYWLHPGQP